MASDSTSGTSLGIRFVAAGEALRGGRRGVGGADPLARIRGQMDPQLTQAMIDAEPKLLAWLRASRHNVVLFTIDPMAALRKALPDFDPALLARIEAMRAGAPRAMPDLPGVSIDRFEVEAPPEKAR